MSRPPETGEEAEPRTFCTCCTFCTPCTFCTSRTFCTFCTLCIFSTFCIFRTFYEADSDRSAGEDRQWEKNRVDAQEKTHRVVLPCGFLDRPHPRTAAPGTGRPADPGRGRRPGHLDPERGVTCGPSQANEGAHGDAAIETGADRAGETPLRTRVSQHLRIDRAFSPLAFCTRCTLGTFCTSPS